MKRKNNTWLILLPVLLILIGGTALLMRKPPTDTATGNSLGREIIIYKSPLCGCCGIWSKYMEEQGYDVEIRSVASLDEINSKNKIPYNMQSCHVAFIDDYFVAGHVPTEVIDKLLAERPDADGITLPDMPAGSPGMPGKKDEPWVFYALKDGQATEFTTL